MAVKRARLKPLIWPLALLALGGVGGWGAEFAVGRWQDYGLYGLTRPVADLLMVIGAVWFVVAGVSTVRRRGG